MGAPDLHVRAKNLYGILQRLYAAAQLTRTSDTMGIFRRKVPHYYIPIHADNIAMDDWIILLEAGTIIGPKKEKLRVAKATKEKNIKQNIMFSCGKTFSRLRGI